jgi:hypothetical protein
MPVGRMPRAGDGPEAGKRTSRWARWPLALAVLLAGCGGIPAGASDTVEPPSPSSLRSARLTAGGPEVFGIERRDESVTVSGAAGGADTRLVFWDEDVPPSRDQLSCATWSSQTGRDDQQGAALRVTTGPRGTRAITVTRNVWIFGSTFNVHLWDTAVESGLGHGLAQFSLSDALVRDGQLSPLPWRFCARVMGSRLEFVVWPLAGPRPPWGDPAHGGAVDLPPGWDGPGHAGWYAGHLDHDERLGFTDLVPAG